MSKAEKVEAKQLRLPVFEGKQPGDADLKLNSEVELSEFDQDALHYGQEIIVVAKVRVKAVSHEMVRVSQDTDVFTRRHKGEILGAYRVDASDLDGFTPKEAGELFELARDEFHAVSQRRRDAFTGQRSMDALLKETAKAVNTDPRMRELNASVTEIGGRKVDKETGEITETDDSE